jgi:phosphonate transport system substrate-binding protein
MFRIIHLVAAIIAAAIGFAPHAGAAQGASERAQHLVIGKVSDNPKKAHPALAAMGDYLVKAAQGSGLKTSSVVLTLTSNEMAERLRKGEVDIVSDTLFGAMIYERDAGAEIALREWKKGVASYKSVIVARADSGIDSLEKLTGKRMAFEDETSTSAYHAPLAIMLKRGLKMRRIDAGAPPPAGAVGYFFAGGETNLLARVHRGMADAGAVSDLDWNDASVTPEVMRREMRVIHESPPITRGVMVARRGIAPAVRNAVLDALVAMDGNEEGKAVLKEMFRVTKYDRFTGEAKETLDRSRALLAPALKQAVAAR